MSTKRHQCPSGLTLLVTEPEPGVLEAVVAGDAELVARVEVKKPQPYQQDRAEYEVALLCGGERQNTVPASCWHEVLPKVCELMSAHGMRGRSEFPVPSSDDRRAHLQRLFELMADQPPVPRPRRAK